MFPNIVRCAVSAHRVPVQTNHFVDIKVQTRKPVRSSDEVKAVLRNFCPLKGLGLPSMPHSPIVVLDEVGRPRPLIDGDYEGGMAVCVGNVHTNDGFFDVTLSVCINNTVRGAWGAALINLELYDLHVRPLVARAAAKQRAGGAGNRNGRLRGSSGAAWSSQHYGRGRGVAATSPPRNISTLRRRRDSSEKYPRRARGDSPPRNISTSGAAAATRLHGIYPRRGRGVAAIRLHGISTL